MTGGLELRGFPTPGQLPELRWLGPDYVALLVHDLTQGLLRQDPGTRVLGVTCEAVPEHATSVDPSGIIRAYDARFALQIFVQDGLGRPLRLRGKWTYVGRGLGTAAASVAHYWELYSAEEA